MKTVWKFKFLALALVIRFEQKQQHNNEFIALQII